MTTTTTKIESRYVDITVASIGIFANGGTLTTQKVNDLVNIALIDGQVDIDEKRALKNIFSRVTEAEVGAETWATIQDVTAKYEL